jgi:hypothetical protein
VNYYIISLDLGQAAEHSALAIVEPRSPDRGRDGNFYDLRHLERLFRYFADVSAKQVLGLMLDNGTGEASRDKQLWRVPKRGVVSATQLALQTDRLRIARGLGLAAEFTKELIEFKPKLQTVTDASAWRDRPTDDLVLAAAGAVWFAGQQTWDEDQEDYEEDFYYEGRSASGGY